MKLTIDRSRLSRIVNHADALNGSYSKSFERENDARRAISNAESRIRILRQDGHGLVPEVDRLMAEIRELRNQHAALRGDVEKVAGPRTAANALAQACREHAERRGISL